jgi:hypothetical protein
VSCEDFSTTDALIRSLNRRSRTAFSMMCRACSSSFPEGALESPHSVPPTMPAATAVAVMKAQMNTITRMMMAAPFPPPLPTPPHPRHIPAARPNPAPIPTRHPRPAALQALATAGAMTDSARRSLSDRTTIRPSRARTSSEGGGGRRSKEGDRPQPAWEESTSEASVSVSILMPTT